MDHPAATPVIATEPRTISPSGRLTTRTANPAEAEQDERPGRGVATWIGAGVGWPARERFERCAEVPATFFRG